MAEWQSRKQLLGFNLHDLQMMKVLEVNLYGVTEMSPWWSQLLSFFRNRAARVDDYIETLQSIHKNFNLPYPAVNQISSSFPFSPKAYRQGKVSSSLTFQQSYHFYQTILTYCNYYSVLGKEFLLK